MRLRDILIVLDGTPRDSVKLEVALALARRHGAHLTGLCVQEHLMPADMSYALGGYPDLWALPEFARQLEAQTAATAARIEAGFREALRREDAAGEWILDTGPLVPSVVHSARLSDLVVLGQADPDNPGPVSARALVEDVLVSAGRPVLIVPYAGRFDTLGTCALIGWTNTRESTRAVHDALPLFDPEGKVTVLSVETEAPDPDALPTADIAEHLARHGLTVTATRTVVTDGLAPADALLDYASDLGADLLVVGGYGHSRTREMVMGGVTRDLLRHMTVPVLMSH
jgi:hypothetical protein